MTCWFGQTQVASIAWPGRRRALINIDSAVASDLADNEIVSSLLALLIDADVEKFALFLMSLQLFSDMRRPAVS